MLRALYSLAKIGGLPLVIALLAACDTNSTDCPRVYRPESRNSMVEATKELCGSKQVNPQALSALGTKSPRSMDRTWFGDLRNVGTPICGVPANLCLEIVPQEATKQPTKIVEPVIPVRDAGLPTVPDAGKAPEPVKVRPPVIRRPRDAGAKRPRRGDAGRRPHSQKQPTKTKVPAWRPGS